MSATLSVADVARMRRTGRIAAYRWLLRNAKKYLRREGREWVIAKSDFALVYRTLGEERIAKRLSDLEEQSREHEARLDKHAEALARMHML